MTYPFTDCFYVGSVEEAERIEPTGSSGWDHLLQLMLVFLKWNSNVWWVQVCMSPTISTPTDNYVPCLNSSHWSHTSERRCWRKAPSWWRACKRECLAISPLHSEEEIASAQTSPENTKKPKDGSAFQPDVPASRTFRSTGSGTQWQCITIQNRKPMRCTQLDVLRDMRQVPTMKRQRQKAKSVYGYKGRRP